jgi:hypothetical protein
VRHTDQRSDLLLKTISSSIKGISADLPLSPVREGAWGRGNRDGLKNHEPSKRIEKKPHSSGEYSVSETR